MGKPNDRNFLYLKARKKIPTRKVVTRYTYCPNIHKQKFRKTQRQNLQKSAPSRKPEAVPQSTHLKFGSFNVNGLDLEANWAVEELLNKRKFDVSIKKKSNHKN